MPDHVADADIIVRGPPAGRRELTRAAVHLTLRLVLSVVFVVGVYALIPVGGDEWWNAALPLTLLGLAIFTLVFVRQLRKVSRSVSPVMTAIEALVVVVLVFLTVFALVAVALEAQSSGSYSEPLTKLDGMYFSVTTLATVGYGDITPVSEAARAIGIVQMLGNLALLGVAVRLIGRAVTKGRVEQEPTE